MDVLSQCQQGIYYFTQGWKIMSKKGLRHFVILPILINILLLVSIFYFAMQQLNDQINHLIALLPSWLAWLSVILYWLAVGLILLVYYFIFNTLSGFLASPFNGLLSEKVEQMLTGETVEDEGYLAMLKDIPRTLKREWQKIYYALPKIILLFLLGFVPFVGVFVVPVLIFLFTAWSQSVQYCDYPFDNHKISFQAMNKALSQYKMMNLTFGILVMIATFIPFVNFLIIPAAICGATNMWVEQYRKQFIH